jgi:phosphoribosylformylglycinamidine synthase
VAHRARHLPPFDVAEIDLKDAAFRVLRMPSVASKHFLIAIGDRTVGGMTARDQMVGPWQVPVADCAVTTLSYQGMLGEAFAMGEKTPLALIDAPASGRMAVGEAVTNLAAALIGDIGRIKLSANWMAAAGHPGEDAALFDTVKAVGLEFCPQLGISIPVGKDSLSMKTAWEDNGAKKQVSAPLSLIISAFATCADVRKTLTPQLRTDCGDTDLVLVDLGQSKHRLGGSAFAQAYNAMGEHAPDADAALLKGFFAAIQELNRDGLLLAYHDRSDGGLFAAACEMAFAGHCGVSLNLDTLCYDPLMNDADGLERKPELASGRFRDRLMGALFAEELGALLQIRRDDRAKVMQVLRAHGLAACSHTVGELNTADEIRVWRNARPLLKEKRIDLQRAWAETSYRIARLRDDMQCAQEEFDSLLDAADPGVSATLTFDPADDVAAPMIAKGAKPKIAILREQGVNGQVEMAAAFDRAGFVAVDVHMSDLQARRVALTDFSGLVACGGFSYGDVLGAGQGWAKSILFNDALRAEFEAFYARSGTFALGVCNGCQMMSNLTEIIPGAERWPRFARNRSEQFEARFVMVDVPQSPSLFLDGMAGSRLPIVVSHGEGRADFSAHGRQQDAIVALRYLDNHGRVAATYPFNPNGSPDGIAGLTTADGRFTIMMPHPERIYRTVQMSWHPEAWGEDGPWLRMFRNARKWLG